MRWILLLCVSFIFLAGCGDTRQYDSFVNEHTTEQEGAYNLYIYYNESLDEIADFTNEFKMEDHLYIRNVQTYRVNDLSSTYQKLAQLDANMLPMYTLYNHEHIELSTSDPTELLDYLRDEMS
ncbi:hypothetical protein RYX56_00095 [Alkalihalophilus lindianensis]|uniref:Uncharacterized protein n=1 Tax=Alkalihalophilus lindianensis TaxID=1630542 RepID=A0ABU3X4E6_9BACI|nr:hypothetical protein [Alkalihalophilus lindianensis]MDV2682764.1 hypothetical protein [Alkalihalophilus lindianensis]